MRTETHEGALTKQQEQKTVVPRWKGQHWGTPSAPGWSHSWHWGQHAPGTFAIPDPFPAALVTNHQSQGPLRSQEDAYVWPWEG